MRGERRLFAGLLGMDRFTIRLMTRSTLAAARGAMGSRARSSSGKRSSSGLALLTRTTTALSTLPRTPPALAALTLAALVFGTRRARLSLGRRGSARLALRGCRRRFGFFGLGFSPDGFTYFREQLPQHSG